LEDAVEEEKLQRIRRALTLHRDTLLEWIDTDSTPKDICCTGTSNSDVMQMISELEDALGRIERGDFGRCEECGGEVESEHLELDFTACVCLDHYDNAQLRTLERELEHAARVQRHLLPRAVPEISGLQIAARAESAGILGGDYYDFFQCSRGTYGMVVADVMGNGLPASMLMSNLQAAVRILGPQQPDPGMLAASLNKVFRYNVKLTGFISVFMAEIDMQRRTLSYCNAGHHPPIHWQAGSAAISWLAPTGPAIGLAPNPRFATGTLPLNEGDLLLFYTDGLVEARNSRGEEFSEERLASYVSGAIDRNPDALVTGLREEAKSFAGAFHDDVTLLAIKVL
jgi:sigma-B regulation protein RsbU (phosphoserine phosphatase)